MTENGKTMDESYAEVDKSMELCEFACSLPQLVQGELLEVSKGVECRIERKPLGVVASIAPFNFPNMVPHWTIPNALMLGNTMILKPSEVVPISGHAHRGIAERSRPARWRLQRSERRPRRSWRPSAIIPASRP
jgi:acyl-CoA reductase-like NAD-dependent aldehyde dehydrogenase